MSDASSYWYVNFDGTTVYVNTMVAGTSSVQTSGAATGAPGDVVRVVCSGSTVQLKINGVAAGSLVTNSFNATATKVGLTLRAGSAAARWDSFLVTVP